MLRRRFTISALVISVMAGVVFPPMFPGGGNSDANGDKQIDVRDIQMVISRVLAGEEGISAGDVNGDGRIDILDFQALLEQVSQGNGEAPGNHAPSSPPAVFQTLRSDGVPITKCVLVPKCVEEIRPYGAKPLANEPESAIRLAQEALYVLGLTQHAPPCFA